MSLITNNERFMKDMKEIVEPSVKCYNGIFIGSKDNGIFSFKGIPYAKAPIGELRWKAPQSADYSNEFYDATHFGKSALQIQADSEQASYNPEGMSENCLTLNIWTSSLEEKNKPVMVWIHGGAYSYGGTSDPLYNGQFIVKEHPEVIVVSINYRIGPMGFIDFSQVIGGENFKTSAYNGILDQIEALKWVQQNIKSFGGNPQNVTIFGESAGGGSVTELLVAKGTEGLFQHAIAESGSVNFTMTHERFAEIGVAEKLLKKAGATCMDDLMNLSEEKLYEIYIDESDEMPIGAMSVLPLRGDDSIIPLDPYQEILNGAGKDVDLIIGSTADECRYFIDDVCKPSLMNLKGKELQLLTEKKLSIYAELFAKGRVNRTYSLCSEQEKQNLDEFLSLYANDEEIWQKTSLINEYSFRSPAIKVAYNHAIAKGKGKTYMYYFCKNNTNFDWIGACHASELSYVFHNLDEEHFSGFVIQTLADKMCGLWTSFALNGIPKYGDINWLEYTPENRETLFFNNDGSTTTVYDPMKKERELIDPILYHYIAL